MGHARRLRQSGFSTIELVLAVTILVIAGAGLASLSRTTTGTTIDNKDRAAALALAMQKVEDLKNARLPELVAGTYADASNPIDEKGSAGGVFTRTWQISDGTLSSVPITEILVRVGWVGGGEIELRTRIARIPQLDLQYSAYPGAFPSAAVRSWEER
jgi:type II secretory pathway pseudopilin PulG